MRDNGIEQDLIRNIIFLDNRKITVQPTRHTSIMPTAPIFGTEQVNKLKTSQLLSFKFRILLPEQETVIPLDRSDGSIVAMESWEQNKWPDPHLQ